MALIPQVLFWNKWRKKTESELANLSLPGKWLLKQTTEWQLNRCTSHLDVTTNDVITATALHDNQKYFSKESSCSYQTEQQQFFTIFTTVNYIHNKSTSVSEM